MEIVVRPLLYPRLVAPPAVRVGCLGGHGGRGRAGFLGWEGYVVLRCLPGGDLVFGGLGFWVLRDAAVGLYLGFCGCVGWWVRM